MANPSDSSAHAAPAHLCSVLDPAARRAVLGTRRAARRDVDELTWIAAFERRVARDPDAVAVVCEDVALTYARARRRARGARPRAARPRRPRRGRRRRRRAALGWSMVVALLGVMRAGAAYLPLDLDHPPDRIAFMLRDAARGSS